MYNYNNAGKRGKSVGMISNMGGEDREVMENLSGQDQYDIEQDDPDPLCFGMVLFSLAQVLLFSLA